MGFFSIAASGGEATDAADSVSQCEAGSKGVASPKSRHVMFHTYQAAAANAASNPPEKTPPACKVLVLKISLVCVEK